MQAKAPVLGLDHGRADHLVKRGHLGQRHLQAARALHEHRVQHFDTVAQLARVGDAHGVAFAPFERAGDRHAADRRHDRLLDVAQRQPVVAHTVPVDLDLDVGFAADVLDVGARHARNGRDAVANAPCDRFEVLERLSCVQRVAIRPARVADELHGEGSADPGVQHDDARLDRL